MLSIPKVKYLSFRGFSQLLRRNFPSLCLGCKCVILQNPARKSAECKVHLQELIFSSSSDKRVLARIEEELKKAVAGYFCKECLTKEIFRSFSALFVPLQDELPITNGEIALVPFYYKAAVPSVIRRLKFAEEWELGDSLGEILFLYWLGVQAAFILRQQLVLSDRGEFSWRDQSWFSPGWRQCFPKTREREIFYPDYILPLPLHENRLSERGYNQAACIAKAFAAQFHPQNAPVYRDDLLLRLKNTARQSEQKDKLNRFRNLQDAFYCPDLEALKGKIVYLFDDVLTTGTTLHEAVETLRRAEVGGVLAFAAASNRLVLKSPLFFCGRQDM